jgi:hypothetical protein
VITVEGVHQALRRKGKDIEIKEVKEMMQEI